MRYLNGGSFKVAGAELANPWLFYIGFALVLYVMYGWWADTVKEAHEGAHTRVVSLHLRYGMIMFIASEVMFFVAWFWAYFDASLYPNEAIQASRLLYTGCTWPPKGIEVLDPWHLPIYNTVILLLSGTTVTWAHHALLHNDRKGLIQGLTLTVLLGVLFSSVQAYEYAH
ncbi:cytochrome c oxidase subunit 3, partial [Rhizobium ruizarguesonis]